MERLTLGNSDLAVSAWCLGTMTWGTQTPEEDAHRQIAMALDAGIDFLDTAELYPVNPISAETSGRTEEIIGNWIARTGRRDDLVIATKIVGEGSKAVRGGLPITPGTIREAVEGSLRRLRTDVIDLYQLHWPNRGSYHFRKNWTYDPSGRDPRKVVADMAETVEEIGRQIAMGRIREWGLSNESAWGTMTFLRLADELGVKRPVTIQNEYSLLNRLFDTDMAEVSVMENVDLLAYSPLAAGLLTGKYRGMDDIPPGTRRAVNPTLFGRVTERVFPAIAAYADVARRNGLDLAQMALAWIRHRPFPAIPIVGATTAEQLARLLPAIDLALPEEVLAEIDAAHKLHPMPF